LGYFRATSASDSHITIGVEISYCSLCFVFLLFLFIFRPVWLLGLFNKHLLLLLLLLAEAAIMTGLGE